MHIVPLESTPSLVVPSSLLDPPAAETPVADPSDALYFLQDVFQGLPPDRVVVLVALPSGEHLHVTIDEHMEDVAEWIRDRSAAGESLYFSAGAHDPAATKGTRQKESVRWHRAEIVDVDFRGLAHKAENLPPDLAWVKKHVLSALPEPTYLIDSGHGCYLIWLLDQPVVVDDAAGVPRIHDISRRMQDRVRAILDQHGYHLDDTSEPSHLFRLPGSLNRKAGQVRRVSFVEDLEEAREYSLADLGLGGAGPASAPIPGSGPSAAPVLSLPAASLLRASGTPMASASSTLSADGRTPEEITGAARAFLGGLVDPKYASLARTILDGRAFPHGERDTDLQVATSLLANAFPTAEPETLAEIFAPTVEAMATESPDDHPSIDDVADKISRNQAQLRPRKEAEAAQHAGIRRGLAKAAAARVAIYPFGAGQFRCDSEGLWYDTVRDGIVAAEADSEPEPPIWLSSPIKLLAASRDADGVEWGRLVEVSDLDGKPHVWAMPSELLAGDGSDLRRELLRLGARLANGKRARELLGIFLGNLSPTEKVRCVSRLGWHGGAYITPDGAIGDATEKTVYQGPSIRTGDTSGTVEEWRAGVATLAAGNSRFGFGISAAFAGPLLNISGEDSGGFHFGGPSSSSKTTILRAAASVWGNPTDRVRTWRATSNGLEGVAAQHNDGTLFLDEMGQCDPREAGAVAYMLANGQGKSRANRTGGAREAARWRLLFVSTGEVGLAAHVAESGQRRTRAGQEIRLAEVPIDAGAGMGGVESLHGHATPAALSEATKAAASRSYGAVGIEFLRRLVADRSRIASTIGADLNAFVAKACPPGTSGQVMRVARRFAIVARAGELATSYGLTGWPAGEAMKAAETCFRAWIEGFGGAAGQREDRAILEQVRRFLEAHGSSRFEAWDAGDSQRIINRVGFRKPIRPETPSVFGSSAEGTTFEYFILPEAFRTEVCAGIDHKQAAKVLAAAGCLVPDPDGKNLAAKRRLPGMGSVRAYMISSKIWEV